MKAALIQVQLGLNAQVLRGLYEEIANLRKARKHYNEIADFNKDTCDSGVMPEGSQLKEDTMKVAEEYRAQAAIYSPYIKKFAKRIAAIEAVQRALKQELKFQQSMEAWNVEEDAFWLEQARVAAEEGFVEPAVVNKLLTDFEEF
jgi:hypothetical protein